MTEEDTKDFSTFSTFNCICSLDRRERERERVVRAKGSYEIKVILTLWDS